jgi:hypothetical protein
LSAALQARLGQPEVTPFLDQIPRGPVDRPVHGREPGNPALRAGGRS